MMSRTLLAAVLAGLVAGLLMALVLHARITPMILQAETFEHVAHGHVEPDGKSVESHAHNNETWSPANGLERTIYTSLTSVLTAIGFAFLLMGVSFVSGLKISRKNGWIWGLCGFAAFSFAPSFGLPPELPGMASAPVNERLVWWFITIALTSAAFLILAIRRDTWAICAAIVNLVVPHVWGAPKAGLIESKVPAELAVQFATNSLAANAVLWLTLGISLAFALTYLKVQSDDQ